MRIKAMCEKKRFLFISGRTLTHRDIFSISARARLRITGFKYFCLFDLHCFHVSIFKLRIYTQNKKTIFSWAPLYLGPASTTAGRLSQVRPLHHRFQSIELYLLYYINTIIVHYSVELIQPN